MNSKQTWGGGSTWKHQKFDLLKVGCHSGCIQPPQRHTALLVSDLPGQNYLVRIQNNLSLPNQIKPGQNWTTTKLWSQNSTLGATKLDQTKPKKNQTNHVGPLDNELAKLYMTNNSDATTLTNFKITSCLHQSTQRWMIIVLFFLWNDQKGNLGSHRDGSIKCWQLLQSLVSRSPAPVEPLQRAAAAPADWPWWRGGGGTQCAGPWRRAWAWLADRTWCTSTDVSSCDGTEPAAPTESRRLINRERLLKCQWWRTHGREGKFRRGLTETLGTK